MADKPGTTAPAVPFSGDREPRAHLDRLDEAEDILGRGKGPVYEVKSSQWGHDQYHWKRGELLREDDLAPHYDFRWAMANGTIEPASGEVNARMGVRRRSKRDADEDDDEEGPYAAAERGDPDDEGAKPSQTTTRSRPRREPPFEAAKRTDPDDEGAKPKLDPDDARVRAEQGLMPAGGHEPATGIHVEPPKVQGSTGHAEVARTTTGGAATGHTEVKK